jgi:hypothetical protein
LRRQRSLRLSPSLPPCESSRVLARCVHTGAVGLDNADDAQRELESAVKEVFAWEHNQLLTATSLPVAQAGSSDSDSESPSGSASSATAGLSTSGPGRRPGGPGHCQCVRSGEAFRLPSSCSGSRSSVTVLPCDGATGSGARAVRLPSGLRVLFSQLFFCLVHVTQSSCPLKDALESVLQSFQLVLHIRSSM